MTATKTRALVLPLATLAAAAGVAVASGATFNTATASSGLAASGTLRQINSNSVAFSKDNLKPGDTVTGTVSITNSGTLPATFSLTEGTVTNTFSPASDVQLLISDEAGNPVSNTTLGAAGPVSLGTWAAGEKHTYTYKVSFASTATNAQQGKRAETTYSFTSVQTSATNYTGTQGGTASDVPTP
jgi:uncharacterized repeat protein (TIGR01451 family)